jgi:hypothetical protein
MSAKPNRQNFWMLTVPVRTVRMMMWQDRKVCMMMMWQFFIACLLVNQVETSVQLVASNMRTRGPIPGCHMSPSVLVYLVI